MKNLALILLIFIPLFVHESRAQDPQFSQFYAAPLYLNPAFAGSTGLARFGLNYRNQWPSINANFVTYSAYFDYFFEDYNSGVGVIAMSDQEGTAGLRAHSFGLQYAYHLRITDGLTFRPGFQASANIRSLNYNNLIFGNQITDNGPDPGIDPGEAFASENIFFVDLAAGGLFYSRDFWVGGAVHHLTEPDQSFAGDVSTSPLPMKYSFHGGYKIPLKYDGNVSFLGQVREVSLTPAFQYKSQAQFDQLDLGMYFTYEPLVLGLWYRGLPIKPFEGFPNNESIIAMVGLTMNNFNVGYSFDYTISELEIASGGAHEISLSYQFFMGNPRKPPKNVRSLPCPKF